MNGPSSLEKGSQLTVSRIQEGCAIPLLCSVYTYGKNSKANHVRPAPSHGNEKGGGMPPPPRLATFVVRICRFPLPKKKKKNVEEIFKRFFLPPSWECGMAEKRERENLDGRNNSSSSSFLTLFQQFSPPTYDVRRPSLEPGRNEKERKYNKIRIKREGEPGQKPFPSNLSPLIMQSTLPRFYIILPFSIIRIPPLQERLRRRQKTLLLLKPKFKVRPSDRPFLALLKTPSDQKPPLVPRSVAWLGDRFRRCLPPKAPKRSGGGGRGKTRSRTAILGGHLWAGDGGEGRKGAPEEFPRERKTARGREERKRKIKGKPSYHGGFSRKILPF